MLELANATDDPERVAFSEYYAAAADRAAFMIRKGRRKYIHYVGYEPELFDLESDPEELTNLAADPAHKETLDELSEQLDTWIEESGDHGKTPESWEAYDGEMEVYFESIRKRGDSRLSQIKGNVAQMKKWAEEGK